MHQRSMQSLSSPGFKKLTPLMCTKWIKNNPVVKDNTKIANENWGEDVGHLKGHKTCKKLTLCADDTVNTLKTRCDAKIACTACGDFGDQWMSVSKNNCKNQLHRKPRRHSVTFCGK